MDVVAAPTTPMAFSTSPAPARALPWPPALVASLAVTVVAALLAPALAWVTLPFVDRDSLAFLLDDAPTDLTQLSVIALGVMPWISSSLLVEITALVVPKLRPLRHGAPEQRARLDRAALVIGVVVAIAQAWMLVQWVSALVGSTVDSIAPELWATGPRVVVVATLVGGSCLVRLAAMAIDRVGVGNGLAVILAGVAIVAFGQDVAVTIDTLREDVLTPAQSLLTVALIGVPAALAWRLVRVRPDDDVPSRGHASLGALQAARFVVRPSAGLVPFTVALAIPAGLASAGAFVDVTMPSQTSLVVVSVLVAAAAVPVCAALFSSPARAAIVHARLASDLPFAGSRAPREAPAANVVAGDAQQASARAEAADAMPHTWVFNGALIVAWALGSLALPYGFIDAILVVTLVITARDVVGEVQARRATPGLVSIWSLHRFDLLGPALAALASENIEGHLRGAHLRALSHFFAPWLPVEILVDAPHAERARSVVRALVERAIPHVGP